MDPMADKLPVVEAAWMVQAESLIAHGHCPKCKMEFGLSGSPELLGSGDAKHWCRICQTLFRVAVSGKPPDVTPLEMQSQYVAECVALAREEGS